MVPGAAFRKGKIADHTSAADLKFLDHLQQAPLGISNRKAVLES
jgi:hypothetical protein